MPNAEHDAWVIEVDWSEPDQPRLVGPFHSRADAYAWGERNIRNGDWGVAPLAKPTRVIPPEPAWPWRTDA